MPGCSGGSHCCTETVLSRELGLNYSKALGKKKKKSGKERNPIRNLSSAQDPRPRCCHLPSATEEPPSRAMGSCPSRPAPIVQPFLPAPLAPRRRPGAGGKTGSAPQHGAAEMRQAGWSGGEDGGRKRTGYLEPTANSWAYLCAAEAQESLQNSAQLERGPRLGTRPRPQRHPWCPAGRRDAGGREGTRIQGGGWHLRPSRAHRRDLTPRCSVGMGSPRAEWCPGHPSAGIWGGGYPSASLKSV